MIAVAVQFDNAAIPQAVGQPEINVTVSFPRVNIVSNGGVFDLESFGNGTTTIAKAELEGKTVLQVTTDGRTRSRIKNEFGFTSSTGTTVFASAVQTTQVIQWLYK